MRSFKDLNSTKDKQLARYLWALIIATIILATSFFVYTSLTYVEVDKNFCPTKNSYGNSVILFDNSDKNNEITVDDIKNVLENVKESLNKYERLVIFSLNDDPRNKIEPIFEICNPGNVDNLRFDQKTGLTANPAMIEKKYNELFNKKVSKIISDMFNTKPSNTSPIFEMIQMVNVKVFKHAELKSGYSNRLIIISDLIQNTSKYSQYYESLAFNSFKEKKKNYLNSIWTNLDEVIVNLNYINREKNKNIQTNKHINFWENYFYDLNVSSNNLIIEKSGK